MGDEEMKEIASIIKLILSNTNPTSITKGKNAGKHSQARYKTEPEALEVARNRVSALLDRYPVYPELDLDYLEQTFA